MKTAIQKSGKPDEYREWFDKEVELGLADIEAGRIVSHEEVRVKVAKLIVQHSKKAA